MKNPFLYFHGKCLTRKISQATGLQIVIRCSDLFGDDPTVARMGFTVTEESKPLLMRYIKRHEHALLECYERPFRFATLAEACELFGGELPKGAAGSGGCSALETDVIRALDVVGRDA